MELKDFLEKCRVMRNIKRFGMETVIHPQNLCDHGYSVATLFYLLCQLKKIKVSAEDMFIVLNHDFAESYTSDINRLVKEKNEETIKSWEIIEFFSLPTHLKHWQDSSIVSQLGEEKSKLFQLADCIDAYLYCRDEVRTGNDHLSRAVHVYRTKMYHILLAELDAEQLYYDIIKGEEI